MRNLLIWSLIVVLALNWHMRHLLVASLVFALVSTGCGPAGTATYGESR
jgi:hypothetical protein